MNIYFFIKDVSLTGGTERVTVNLASLFEQKGHCVTIVSYYHGKEPMTYQPVSGVRVVYLLNEKCPDSENRLIRLQLFGKALGVLKQFFKENKITEGDVIISQNFFSNTLMWLSGHAGKVIGCEHFKYDVYPKMVRAVRCYVYSHLKCVVTLTEKDRQRFVKHLKEEKTATIANMVMVRDNVKPDSHSKEMIAVGRLTPQKGFDMLIDAMVMVKEKHSDWKINIFGEGEDRKVLQERIERAELQRNVMLCGYSTDIDKEFCKSAFLVLSSRFEGFPLVLIEALGQGIPSVAFDCPEGPAQLLEKGGGILVEKENVAKLAEAICYMIEHPEFREKCMKYKEYIRQHLDPDVIYEKWMQLFGRLS